MSIGKVGYISTFIDPEEPDKNIDFIDESSEEGELFKNSIFDELLDSFDDSSS